MSNMFFFLQINKDVSRQSFLTKNKVFSEVVQYDFEACRNDKVTQCYSRARSSIPPWIILMS